MNYIDEQERTMEEKLRIATLALQKIADEIEAWLASPDMPKVDKYYPNLRTSCELYLLDLKATLEKIV